MNSEKEAMRTTNLLIVRAFVGAAPKVFGKTVKVSVCTNRSVKNKDGEWEEKSDWLTLTVLSEKRAAWIAENVKKGDYIYAEARVADLSYETGDATIYTVDVIADEFDVMTPKKD
jgi:single-stranded DNA-binding protein